MCCIRFYIWIWQILFLPGEGPFLASNVLHFKLLFLQWICDGLWISRDAYACQAAKSLTFVSSYSSITFFFFFLNDVFAWFPWILYVYLCASWHAHHAHTYFTHLHWWPRLRKYSDFMCCTQGNWIFHCVIWSTLVWGECRQMRRLISASHCGMLLSYC